MAFHQVATHLNLGNHASVFLIDANSPLTLSFTAQKISAFYENEPSGAPTNWVLIVTNIHTKVIDTAAQSHRGCQLTFSPAHQKMIMSVDFNIAQKPSTQSRCLLDVLGKRAKVAVADVEVDNVADVEVEDDQVPVEADPILAAPRRRKAAVKKL